MFNSFVIYFFFIVVFFCLLNFFLYKNHLLCLLLSLEFFMLMVYFMLCVNFCLNVSDYNIGLYYLTLAVCDGGLGLSMLVTIIRSHGNEMTNSMIISL